MILLNRRKYIHKRSPQGAPIDIGDAVISLANDTFYYTGNPIYPSVTVTYEGATLIANTDYTLNYSDNTNVGSGTVSVTGMGMYSGQVTKTFYIIASVVPDDWAAFDLSQLADEPLATASLRDSTAHYLSTENVTLYGIQTLPNDRIFFSSAAQGHPYIWGFDEGHPFEVSHFKSAFDSRGRSTAYYKGGTLASDGTVLYDYNSTGFNPTAATGAYKTMLNSAYALSSGNTRAFVATAIDDTEPCRMQFSHDGLRLFFKDESSALLKCATLLTPWDLSSITGVSSFALGSSISGLPSSVATVYAFQFSPNGKTLVFSYADGPISSVGTTHYLVKLSLSTAYDLSTASVHSYKGVFLGANCCHGIAVNNAGTKILLFKWNGSVAREFQEYNLTT